MYLTFLKLVGIALLVTSFLVSLMDKTSAGDFSINNFFRHLLKYFILYILLINANTILTDLLDITTGTFDALKTSTDEITANSAAVEFNHVFWQIAFINIWDLEQGWECL